MPNERGQLTAQDLADAFQAILDMEQRTAVTFFCPYNGAHCIRCPFTTCSNYKASAHEALAQIEGAGDE